MTERMFWMMVKIDGEIHDTDLEKVLKEVLEGESIVTKVDHGRISDTAVIDEVELMALDHAEDPLAHGIRAALEFLAKVPSDDPEFGPKLHRVLVKVRAANDYAGKRMTEGRFATDERAQQLVARMRLLQQELETLASTLGS